jgi:hypothetical protein
VVAGAFAAEDAFSEPGAAERRRIDARDARRMKEREPDGGGAGADRVFVDGGDMVGCAGRGRGGRGMEERWEDERRKG